MRIAPRNYVLAGVLAVLSLLLVTGGGEELPAREISRFAPALVPAEARRVEVTSGPRRVTLQREESGWVLAELHGFPADRQLVERVLEVLAELTTLDLLTEDPARHAEYGLDEASAQRLTVLGADDGVVADLYVGRAPSGSAFVRRVGEDAVYGASVLPRTSSEPVGWQRTIALVPVEPALVLRLELSGPELGGADSPIVLKRDGRGQGRWLDAADKEVPRASAEGLVRALTTLFVDRMLAPELGADGGAAHGLDAPRFTVRVTATASGRGDYELEARIGSTATEGLVPAVGPSGPWVVGLREASVARILQHAAPLRR